MKGVIKTIHAGVDRFADFDDAVYIRVVEFPATGNGMKRTDTTMCPERALHLATQLIEAVSEVLETRKKGLSGLT